LGYLFASGGVEKMPKHSPFVISLSSKDRKILEDIARKYTSPYRDVVRAKVVLYAAQGLSNKEIASRIDLPRQIVSKWRKRFAEDGFEGLEERSRQGRPRLFSPRHRRRGQGPRLPDAS
jgi:transposase-like protein